MFPTDLSDLSAAAALDLADRVDHAADAVEADHIRTDAASAAWFDASIDRVADGLAPAVGSRSAGEGPTPTPAWAPTASGT
jgi:hypothetical protein